MIDSGIIANNSTLWRHFEFLLTSWILNTLHSAFPFYIHSFNEIYSLYEQFRICVTISIFSPCFGHIALQHLFYIDGTNLVFWVNHYSIPYFTDAIQSIIYCNCLNSLGEQSYLYWTIFFYCYIFSIQTIKVFHVPLKLWLLCLIMFQINLQYF